MEKVLVHITELGNQTNQVIEFEVENRYFHLRALPPGKKRHVKLWKVLKAKHECPKLKIRFMMNKDFSGLEINAIQLLYYARIIIKLQRVGEGLYLPYLEAILEKPIDHWLRLKYIGCPRDKYWDKRPSCRIWPEPTWAKKFRPKNILTSIRVVEAQSPLQLVIPVANPSLLQSCRSIEELATEGESNEIKINAIPPLEEPGPAEVLSSPEREKKAISFHMNDEKRIVSSLPAAAFQPEEHGPPKRSQRITRRPDRGGSDEKLERGSAGNMPELPQQKEDDYLHGSIKCKDMEKTVQLMILDIAFICVLLFKFLV